MKESLCRRLKGPFLFLIFAIPCMVEAASDPLRYQSGIRNSPGERRLTPNQLQAIVVSLREKTGLPGLEFGEDGFLRLGNDTVLSEGSKSARDLLLAALNGDLAFDLENHSRSHEIAFARCGSPISFQSRMSGSQIEMVPLELDFTDFDKLRGDKQVKKSFDYGIVILHELAHGALRLSDARTRDEGPGDCENYINIIRRDLGLPERQHYFARVIERSSGSTTGATTRTAELVFLKASTVEGREKKEFFILSWEASVVGQIKSQSGIPRSKSGTMAMQ
jgi:hypothetical protein